MAAPAPAPAPAAAGANAVMADATCLFLQKYPEALLRFFIVHRIKEDLPWKTSSRTTHYGRGDEITWDELSPEQRAAVNDENAQEGNFECFDDNDATGMNYCCIAEDASGKWHALYTSATVAPLWLAYYFHKHSELFE